MNDYSVDIWEETLMAYVNRFDEISRSEMPGTLAFLSPHIISCKNLKMP